MNEHERHTMTDDCWDVHCDHHGVDEPMPPLKQRQPGAALCPGCFHYYPSGQDLVDTFRVEVGQDTLGGNWPDLLPEHIERCLFCDSKLNA